MKAIYSEVPKDYFDGAVDLETAKTNFQTSIGEKYPELTEVVWPE